METKEKKLIKLLQDINRYRFNFACDCPTCENLKSRIKKEIKSTE
jgi:hypothetical protein